MSHLIFSKNAIESMRNGAIGEIGQHRIIADLMETAEKILGLLPDDNRERLGKLSNEVWGMKGLLERVDILEATDAHLDKLESQLNVLSSAVTARFAVIDNELKKKEKDPTDIPIACKHCRAEGFKSPCRIIGGPVEECIKPTEKSCNNCGDEYCKWAGLNGPKYKNLQYWTPKPKEEGGKVLDLGEYGIGGVAQPVMAPKPQGEARLLPVKVVRYSVTEDRKPVREIVFQSVHEKTKLWVYSADLIQVPGERMERAKELLAEYAHETWAGWMRYMLPKINSDEGPAWLVRWERLMNTSFIDLSEDEKKSDYAEAEKIAAILKEAENV